MFCPDNYFTLYEIFHECGGAAFQFVSANPPTNTPPPTPAGFYIDTGEDFDTMTEAYQLWLFQNFMLKNERQLYATSPTGVVARMAPELTVAYRLYDGPFPESIDEQRDLVKTLTGQLAWIDPETFSISPRRPYADQAEFQSSEIGKHLLPISGWAVCWKPPTWPFEISELIAACAERQPVQKVAQDVRLQGLPKKGRPPKGDGVIRRAVQNEFLYRLKKGALPTDQREAINSLIIEWVERIFEEKLGRTTVQQYLGPVYDAIDARN